MGLDQDDIKSIKQSYYNILSLFLSKENVPSKYVGCLLKWSAQLNLSQSDLHHIEGNFHELKFTMPETKLDRIEAIYHIIHMIYLDNVVEDIELEVATLYATELGFKPYIVGELFKAIATAPFDGKSTSEVKKEVEEFLALHEE